MCEKNGKHVLYERIYIADSPTECIGAYFKQINGLIDRSLKEEKKFLIHCQSGISRSSSLMIAYVMHDKK